MKEDRGDVFGDLSGTADLAYYFLALADRLTMPKGAVGFVLPRGVEYEFRAETQAKTSYNPTAGHESCPFRPVSLSRCEYLRHEFSPEETESFRGR